MAKTILTVLDMPAWVEDASTQIEHSLDEEYEDGNQVNQTSYIYDDLDEVEEAPWGIDPAISFELSKEKHHGYTY